MGEIRPLAWLGELRPPRHLVNCTQSYASTPTIKLSPTVNQLHNGSVKNKTKRKKQKEWLLQLGMEKPVLLWEPCCSLGNKTIAWFVRKARTDIRLADLVYFEVQCLKSSSILVLHINRKLMNRYESLIFSKKIHTK